MVLGEAWLYRDICPAFEKKLKTEEDILKLGSCYTMTLQRINNKLENEYKNFVLLNSSLSLKCLKFRLS